MQSQDGDAECCPCPDAEKVSAGLQKRYGGRHASPRAALMFTSGTSHGEATGSYRGEPLYHASLAPEEYRALLKTNGFRVVAHIAEDPDCGGRTVWLAQTE